MNRLFHTIIIVLPIFLTACAGKPLEPYHEPPMGVETANLRIVTNGTVSGGKYEGCLGDRELMAKAGRFHHNGVAHKRYTQFPVETRKIGMPDRVSPYLISYLDLVFMAEGNFEELATEYKVPANTPFLLEAHDLLAGSYGSSYYKCPAKRQVYFFEPNKNYEAYIGLTNRKDEEGRKELICPFVVMELVSVKSMDSVIPVLLSSEEPTKKPCSSSK